MSTEEGPLTQDELEKQEKTVREKDERTAHIVSEGLRARGKLLDTQKKVFNLTQTRCEKQAAVEHNHFKIKQIDDRLRTVENNITYTKSTLKLEARGPDQILNGQKLLKIAYEQQQEYHTRILRLLRRRDHVMGQLKISVDREDKYRERMQGLLDRLKNQMEKQNKVKKSIILKVDHIKALHQSILNVEPKLRMAHTRMRRVEVICFDLEDKINRRQEDLGKIKLETEVLHVDINQAKVKYELEKGKTFKGMDAKRQLIKV